MSEYKQLQDMTPEEAGVLLLAHSRGDTLQSSDDGEYWRDTLSPSWLSAFYYRVKSVCVEQEMLMYARHDLRYPYVAHTMSDPTHQLTFIWEDDKLIRVDVAEVNEGE